MKIASVFVLCFFVVLTKPEMGTATLAQDNVLGGRNTHDVHRREKGNQNNVKENAKKDFDCDEGCDLSNGGQVCGVDGNTYFNECLAVCQEVEIDRPGACPGKPPISVASESTYTHQGTVSLQTMKHFEDEGFRYVAKRKRVKFEPDQEHGEEETQGDSDNKPMCAVILTAEGDEYISGQAELSISIDYEEPEIDYNATAIEDGEDFGADNNRGLQIIGPDNRSK